MAAVAAVVWLLSLAYIVHFGSHWFLDLRVYRAAGASLYHGGRPFEEYFTQSHLPFTYPPFALLALSPLSLGPLRLVEMLWWAASSAALVLLLARLLGSARASGLGEVGPFRLLDTRAKRLASAALLAGVATLALEPVRSNMDYGQINLILMLLVVVDCTTTKQTWWHGCLVGLAGAVKLTPLLFLLAFLMAKDWRSLARGVGTFVGVTAVSWLVLPSASATYWFHQVTDAGRTGPLAITSNQSWNGLLHRPPFHWDHWTHAAWVLLVVVVIACGAWLAKVLMDAGRRVELVMALGLTELLVSPVSWTHHWSWVVVVPIAAPLLWRSHRAVAVLLAILLALAVSSPYLWVRAHPLSYVFSNSLVLAGAAVLVCWSVAEWVERKASPAGVGVPPPMARRADQLV